MHWIPLLAQLFYLLLFDPLLNGVVSNPSSYFIDKIRPVLRIVRSDFSPIKQMDERHRFYRLINGWCEDAVRIILTPMHENTTFNLAPKYAPLQWHPFGDSNEETIMKIFRCTKCDDIYIYIYD